MLLGVDRPTRLSIEVLDAADPSAPTKLFEGNYGASANQTGRTYDIAPDGKRFLMIKAGSSADQTAVPTSLVVVQNWREELKRLAPTQ